LSGIAAGRYKAEDYVMPQLDQARPTAISSWNETQELAEMLPKVDPDYRYRPPTEAEWEYGCRSAADGVGSDDGD
jgi:formylglycine-generating enzyme required for sulfatase activity